jgi:hypothetical protein
MTTEETAGRSFDEQTGGEGDPGSSAKGDFPIPGDGKKPSFDPQDGGIPDQGATTAEDFPVQGGRS